MRRAGRARRLADGRPVPCSASRGTHVPRPLPELACSQQNLERAPQGRLGAGEVPSEFDQAGRTAAWPADPAAQRLPCDVRAFEVTQSDDIDERALCGVETDRSASADIERFSTEVEGACVELVQSARRPEHRSRSPTGNRDVDY